MNKAIGCAVLGSAALVGGLQVRAVTVDDKVPGGNVVVESVKGNDICVLPDMRDSDGEWFYWAFRVTEAAGQTLSVRFSEKGSYGGDVVGVRGPVVSLDKGKTWSYPLDGKATQKSFSYSVPADVDEVWFYECHPYHQSDWEAFLARHADKRGQSFETGVLCQSRKGRAVEKARFGCLKNAKYTMLLTTRHHASETIASYSVEGFLEAVLADDELGAWFRANVDVMVVPFMDKDGCVDGDQGKHRKPHDHNRDYDKFLYPETKATVAWLKEHADCKVDVWFDMHCPWVRGLYNEFLYVPHTRDESGRNSAAEKRFDELLEKLQCGSMRYKASDDLEFGQRWNTKANYEEGWNANYWGLNSLRGHRLAHTFEIPFANANGAVVTPDTVRALGRDIAKTLRVFLEETEQGK